MLSDVIKIKIPSTVSLAKRAGKVVSGESAVKEAIRFKKAFLVIVAQDVSKNTFKSISDSCSFYNIPLYTLGTKEELGGAIGNNFNAAIAICDKGLADSIEKAIKANINGGEAL